MPSVKVNLYATLRSYVRGESSIDVDVESGQTVREVLEQLGVPPEQTRIVFVNNRSSTLAHQLEGGEQLGIFPAIGGG